MDRRTIDIVAAGPPSIDLYDPAVSAWVLATALSGRGHSVQVTFPGPEGTPPPSAEVAVAPFPPVTAHVGTALGDAELTRAAAHRIRPTAQVIVRDPAGLGAIGLRKGHRPVVAFVRSLGGEAGEAAPGGPVGVVSRLASWGSRRGARRLEREALDEASAICCETAAQKERLRTDYGIPAERLRVVPPAIAVGAEPPARAVARRELGVPDDVPLAILLPPADPALAPAAGPALEGFQRTRPIFPGARLGVVGVPEATGAGVVTVPSRGMEAVTSAVAAADVAVAYAPGARLDPGLVLALRAGIACIVPPSLDLGEGADPAVRRAPTSDSGELASVLAELFADPEGRRVLGESARTFARRFDPARLAEELETAGALGGG